MYLYNTPPKPEPKKPSPFDYITKLVVPVLALVALLVAQLRQQGALMWALLAVVVLSLLAAFFPQVTAWSKKWRQTRRDEQIARLAFPPLRAFVGRFGEFVESNRGDALHEAISNGFARNTEVIWKLGIPPAQLFWGFWRDLSSSADRQDPCLRSFDTIASAFATLVSQYNNYCMQVVFRQLPHELLSLLDERNKSSLNACRERFNEFLRDYENFLGSLEGGFIARHVAVHRFTRVKPL